MATQEWMKNAACIRNMGPDAWFPESHQDPIAVKAQRICKTSCLVRDECKMVGKLERFGIWGGEYHSEEKAKVKAKVVKPVPEMVPALAARRRLQALAALGWTSREVSIDVRRYVGLTLNPERLDLVRNGLESALPKEVSVAIARAVSHLGNRLGSGNCAINLVAEAKEKGWPTPRQWRGIDIDDPKAEPCR